MKKRKVPAVDVHEAQRLVDEEGALLIDCREQKEWDRLRIPGAELKPMSTINDWYQDLPTDRTVVFQCQTGNRSAEVTHALVSQAEMANVVNLTGGIVAWSKAGLPIEK